MFAKGVEGTSASWHHGVITQTVGPEALRCINGLLPRFVSIDKTWRAISIRKPFTTPVGRPVIADAIVF
jgi:hypothetical protein